MKPPKMGFALSNAKFDLYKMEAAGQPEESGPSKTFDVGRRI